MALEGMSALDEGAEPTVRWLCDVLNELCVDQLRIQPNEYLTQHSDRVWIENHVRTFRWYLPYIESPAAVLDWGCQHGPDSALLRAVSSEVILYGCDVGAEDEYKVFRDFTQLRYSQLTSVTELPYESQTFDAVISAGVLEHVASDWNSLHELFRVLRPGGRLVVTYLPNWLSFEEVRLRRSRAGQGGHERLYSRREVRRMLLHSGFRLLTPVLYQTFAWQRQAESVFGRGPSADRIASILRMVAPIHVVRAGALCFVAERVESLR